MNEKIEYLLNHLDHYIEQTIFEVLNDSDYDPQYSAVTLYNLLVCYLDVTHSLGLNDNIASPEAYMRNKCFTEDEILLVKKKKEKESKYYIGVQYSDHE